MSTRGLLGFRFQGQDYVTYNHSDSYPRYLGALIVDFIRDQLGSEEAVQAFGRKIACLDWFSGDGARSFAIQGRALLDAIAAGAVNRIPRDQTLFQTCLDCEFAYVLDLDQGLLEFWDLPDKVETFRLVSIPFFAETEMECGCRQAR
jgi:hypothetical protein